jgi:hypothetical protein
VGPWRTPPFDWLVKRIVPVDPISFKFNPHHHLMG